MSEVEEFKSRLKFLSSFSSFTNNYHFTRMSFRTARPLLQATREQSASRAFSSTASSSSPKFSPLHKTSIARAERAARGQGKGGARGKEKQSMTLEEAHKVLQVSSNLPSPPSRSSQTNLSFALGLVTYHSECGIRTQHHDETFRNNPTQRFTRTSFPPQLLRILDEILLTRRIRFWTSSSPSESSRC